MNILLIEDEAHKRDEMKQCVHRVFGIYPEEVDGVRDAVLRVVNKDYNLVILDMALPTFGGGSDNRNKGHDQAQGGVEVLRALKSAGKTAKILIVTQYPDFFIGSKRTKLKEAPSAINIRYQQEVVGAILYQYKSRPTLQKIVTILSAQK